MGKHTLSIYSLFSVHPSKRLFRVLRGPYSQGELARILGTEQQQVAEWEGRRVEPGPRNIRLLFEHYNAWTTRLGVDPLGLFKNRKRPRSAGPRGGESYGGAVAPEEGGEPPGGRHDEQSGDAGVQRGAG